MAKPPFGHEPAAMNVRAVLRAGAILFVLVLVGIVAIRIALTRDVMPRHAQVVSRRGAVPPPPRLQAHPQIDIAALREQKNAALSGYAWADAAHTTARIPIARAMALYIQFSGQKRSPVSGPDRAAQ